MAWGRLQLTLQLTTCLWALEHVGANFGTLPSSQLSRSIRNVISGAKSVNSTVNSFHPAQVIRDLPPPVRSYIYATEKQSLGGIDTGNGTSYEKVFLFATILSSQNSFRFCAGLADSVLAAESKSHSGAHLAVFRPAKKIEKSLSEARMSIPLSWFRNGAPKAFSIVYCLREQSMVRIVKEVVSASSCSEHTRSYYNECTLPLPHDGARLHSLAVVLDQDWNGAYLIPVFGRAVLTLSMQVHEHSVRTSRLCDLRKGIWPLNMRVELAANDGPQQSAHVTIHHCLGQVVDDVKASDSLLVDVTKIRRSSIEPASCKTVRSRSVALRVEVAQRPVEVTLADDVECSVFNQ